MTARMHRSEAPLPRPKRPGQRQRERLEADGQIVLDLADRHHGVGGNRREQDPAGTCSQVRAPAPVLAPPPEPEPTPAQIAVFQ